MKQKIFPIIACLLLLTSCSKDDDIDRIIGDWQMVESYNNGVQIDLGCNEYLYLIVKDDNSYVHQHKDYNSSPEECLTIEFFPLGWNKNGNRYDISELYNQHPIGKAYFEGDKLIIDITYYNYKSVYIPY